MQLDFGPLHSILETQLERLDLKRKDIELTGLGENILFMIRLYLREIYAKVKWLQAQPKVNPIAPRIKEDQEEITRKMSIGHNIEKE